MRQYPKFLTSKDNVSQVGKYIAKNILKQGDLNCVGTFPHSTDHPISKYDTAVLVLTHIY